MLLLTEVQQNNARLNSTQNFEINLKILLRVRYQAKALLVSAQNFISFLDAGVKFSCYNYLPIKQSFR